MTHPLSRFAPSPALPALRNAAEAHIQWPLHNRLHGGIGIGIGIGRASGTGSTMDDREGVNA